MKRLFLYKLSILWSVLIVVLSTMPGKTFPNIPIWNFDKFVHMLFYSALTFLMLFEFYKIKNKINFYKILNIISISTLLGIILEFTQKYLCVNRSGCYIDAIANFIGSTLGVILFFTFLNYFKNRFSK